MIEVLKQALEALGSTWTDVGTKQYEIEEEAITAIKEALAQPEQEPVAWGVDWGKAGDIPCVSIIKRVPNGGIEVMAVEYAPYSYTTPPQRSESSGKPSAWVGLTDEDELDWEEGGNLKDLVKAIEAKLKEKNT